MAWEDILKLRGIKDDGTEVDTTPAELTNYLTYRSWAWQNAKARKEEGLSGGVSDEEHLDYIMHTKPKKFQMYNPSPEQRKLWISTWNEEFGRRLGVIYPTGDE